MTDAEGIRLIVGLGNPGRDYAATRHNAGFWFVDQLAERFGGSWRTEAKFSGDLCRVSVGGQDLRLLKPTTFMNHSGRAVAAVVRYFDMAPETLLIAYDELDLPPGSGRLKRGGGHAGHNGMRDSISALGSQDFWRLRLGIGHPGRKEQVVSYVLSRPSSREREAIDRWIDEGASALEDLLCGQFQRVMNRLHRKPEPPDASAARQSEPPAPVVTGRQGF
jgi:PTH1 family peptidyl-tRNA hydrolase